MQINRAGLDLLMTFEGFSATAYTCPAGHPTIGWGHKIRKDETFDEPISTKEAEILLRTDLCEIEEYLNRTFEDPLNENQFSALCSFIYNIGIGNFSGSTMKRLISKGCMNDASDEFLRWVHVGGKVSEGLFKRRTEEKHLFLQGVI